MTKCKYDPQDFIGKKFGKWTVLEHVGRNKYGQLLFKCRCECGKEQDIEHNNLLRGMTTQCKSCGSKKHGCRYTRLYGIWHGMKRRCYNSHDKDYEYYGGRGIKVCDEWKNDYMSFQNWALQTGYDEDAKRGDCTIDRINTDGNYEPTNCKWSTTAEQNRNQRKRKTNTSGYVGISYRKGKPKPWSAVICINYKTVCLGSYKTQKESLQAKNDFIIKNNLSYAIQEYRGELKIVNEEQKKVQEEWEKEQLAKKKLV